MTSSPVAPRLRERCAVHPSRPAVDTCPRCGRHRCGADVGAVVAGCLACVDETPESARPARPAGDLERLVRAVLAAYAVALLGGLVASEYVGATVFSYLGPFVVGVVCGGAATRAAETDGRDVLGTRVRVAATVLALLGVALGFALEGSHDPASVGLDVLLPYAAAIAGAVLWTMPPRRDRRPGQGLSTDV